MSSHINLYPRLGFDIAAQSQYGCSSTISGVWSKVELSVMESPLWMLPSKCCTDCETLSPKVLQWLSVSQEGKSRRGLCNRYKNAQQQPESWVYIQTVQAIPHCRAGNLSHYDKWFLTRTDLYHKFSLVPIHTERREIVSVMSHKGSHSSHQQFKDCTQPGQEHSVWTSVLE